MHVRRAQAAAAGRSTQPLGGSMRSAYILVIVLLTGCASTSHAPAPRNLQTFESYVAAVKVHIEKHWVRAEPWNESLYCIAKFTQDHSGRVQEVAITECNASFEERYAIKRAILDSSPIPLPDDPALFDPHIQLNFCPRC
jgi:hypothetical protein